MCTCQIFPQNATNLPWNCNKAIALWTCQVGLKIFKRPCVLCLKRRRLCTHQVLPENVYKANIGLLHIKLYLKMQRKLAKNCNKAITLYTYQVGLKMFTRLSIVRAYSSNFALKCVQWTIAGMYTYQILPESAWKCVVFSTSRHYYSTETFPGDIYFIVLLNFHYKVVFFDLVVSSKLRRDNISMTRIAFWVAGERWPFYFLLGCWKYNKTPPWWKVLGPKFTSGNIPPPARFCCENKDAFCH